MIPPFKKIDFFIIGAPKAGTDSIRNWLSECKSTFVYGPKEPNYFCSDVLSQKKSATLWTTRVVLAGLGNKHIGEKSTWYLGSEVAARRIKTYNRKAKIVILTRSHLSLFKSLHGELNKLGVETIEDPLRAWHESQVLPNRLSFANSRLGNYPISCKIGGQVAHWLAEFGHDQTFILQIGDLADSKCRAALAQFLDLRYYPNAQAGIANCRKEPIRSNLAHSAAKVVESEITKYFAQDKALLDQLREKNRAVHGH